MELKLRNRWGYEAGLKGGWWKWEAFLDDEGSGDLDKVEHVEYVLHPTFSNPVRTISDRESNFALRTQGWGTFPLTAFVYTRDGQKQKLVHEIELLSDPPSGTSGEAGGAAPRTPRRDAGGPMQAR